MHSGEPLKTSFTSFENDKMRAGRMFQMMNTNMFLSSGLPFGIACPVIEESKEEEIPCERINFRSKFF